jgi:hypothetical protein
VIAEKFTREGWREIRIVRWDVLASADTQQWGGEL